MTSYDLITIAIYALAFVGGAIGMARYQARKGL